MKIPSFASDHRVAVKILAALFLLLMLDSAPASATIRYDVSLARPARHFFHVTMTIPNVNNGVALQMPAWNALYEIRDFALHVQGLRATDAGLAPLHVSRVDKQTWRVEGQGDVRVEYDTYWDDSGPFGTQLNADHAFVNLAMILCYIPDRRREDDVLHFSDLPQGWKIAVELPSGAGDATSNYSAAGYDALVDAPAEIGQFDEIRFEAAGRPIRAVVHGDTVDHARITQMLSQIVNYESRLMGDAPFREYLFLIHVGRGFGGGGMEHANSTAIFAETAALLPNVTAHEFFHLWNVKRIRPQSLEPVDYTREMFTPSLWFAEGVTSTYASYTLVRTGLWGRAQFLSDLGDQITELASRPARQWQSAEESSIDTWSENYSLYQRPDFSISYYNKGQLLGVALDITIRDMTNNRASLDDVLRQLNREYAQRGRFYPESAGIREAAEEVVRRANGSAAANLRDFFARYVAGTDEIPFADLLSRAGLTLQTRGQTRPALGFSVSRNAAGDAVIADLDAAGAAVRAGVREGDFLLALDGDDVPASVARWLRRRQPGEMVRVRIRRGSAENDLTFALGEDASHSYSVTETPQPNEKQARILQGLLQGTTNNVR